MRKSIRNAIVAIVIAVGLILWEVYSDELGPTVTFLTGAVGIPLAIGGISSFALRGNYWERVIFTVIPPALYGAYFLPQAMSATSDSDAPSILGAFVVYWALAGVVCLLAIVAATRALRKR